MKARRIGLWVASIALALGLALNQVAVGEETPQPIKRLLYVACPGIRDDLGFGGHGLLVFDIDRHHQFVRRIAFPGLSAAGKPLNVKGIAACAATARIYITTTQQLICIDLITDRVLWEKSYEGGCDRLALSPDGKTIYLPSLEHGHWHVVDAVDGNVLAKIEPKSGAHNTIYGPDGTRVYLAGLHSPILSVADTSKRVITQKIGPFSNVIRPFTINGQQTLCFVNVNDRLGFEIGDLTTGHVMHRVDVEGYAKGAVKMHGCPSHGIALTPDEKELWLADGHNSCVHIFDASVTPPKQSGTIKLRDEPGWITFSIDGTLAWPSTGEVVDVKSHKIVMGLSDETAQAVHSEKLLEIDFQGTKPRLAGNQFGIGQVQSK